MLYSKKGKCYMMKKKGPDPMELKHKRVVMTGVTKVMKKIFFDDYHYEKDPYKRTTGAGSKTGGKERGHRVHQEICDYFNLTVASFRKKYETIHAYTDKAIRFLKTNRLTPIIAEYIICNEQLGFASGIDGLVRTEEGEIIIVEWKTGYDYNFEVSNGVANNIGQYLPSTMDEDTQLMVCSIDNCPKNQAFFQALIYRAALKDVYDVNVKRAIVIQIKQDGVEPHEIPGYLLDLGPFIYIAFCDELKKLREGRKEASKQRRKQGEARRAQKRKAERAAKKRSPSVKKQKQEENEYDEIDDMFLLDLEY
jgi:hypothetical protein